MGVAQEPAFLILWRNPDFFNCFLVQGGCQWYKSSGITGEVSSQRKAGPLRHILNGLTGEVFFSSKKSDSFVAARGDSVVEGNQKQRTWSCTLEEGAWARLFGLRKPCGRCGDNLVQYQGEVTSRDWTLECADPAYVCHVRRSCSPEWVLLRVACSCFFVSSFVFVLLCYCCSYNYLSLRLRLRLLLLLLLLLEPSPEASQKLPLQPLHMGCWNRLLEARTIPTSFD